MVHQLVPLLLQNLNRYLPLQVSTNQSAATNLISPAEMESASLSVWCATIKASTTVGMEATWRKI